MEVCEQVESSPAFGVSDNEKFSDSTNEDLTEAANLICLVYDYYNNGSLAANIEVRYFRYMEECKYGEQMCKDWFEQVKYWYDNDCMPSDEDQEWYATDWVESMLNWIDFEYDESKNPAKRKPKSPKTPETPESPKTEEGRNTRVTQAQERKFKVSKKEFAEFRLCQRVPYYARMVCQR